MLESLGQSGNLVLCGKGFRGKWFLGLIFHLKWSEKGENGWLMLMGRIMVVPLGFVEKSFCVCVCVLIDQPTSVHHWQLKDLLACDDPRTLYSVCDRATVRYDTHTKKVTFN